MEDRLFVRIRGRVQGPYELDKLRALVRRGQLSRMHEVSLDGNSWTQAADYADLFTSPVAEAVAGDKESSSAVSSEADELDVPNTYQDQSWHYATHNERHGPVPFGELRSLAASGQLRQDDRVWTDGMRDWVPAESIPGLLLDTFHVGASAINTAAGSDLERTLSESRPWVKFIAFCAITCGLLSAALGLLSVILGARAKDAVVLAGGLMLLIYAAIFFWGGRLLIKYNSEIGKFLKSGSNRDLDSALRCLRTFWIFCSMILIVILANAIIAVIWAFSIGLVL